jgi:hypothetical protein
MSEDQDFFGSPPSAGDDESPIILGGDFELTDDFATAPADDTVYLGDIHEAADAPILLGGGESYEEPPAPIPETGPSPMQIWNEEWTQVLKVRKDEENARKADLLEAARASLAQFQQEREQKREQKLAKNREDEQAKLEAIEADLENDNSWQKVCKMVELSHDSSQKSSDVKRMRDLLISLKNDTARADALGS